MRLVGKNLGKVLLRFSAPCSSNRRISVAVNDFEMEAIQYRVSLLNGSPTSPKPSLRRR